MPEDEVRRERGLDPHLDLCDFIDEQAKFYAADMEVRQNRGLPPRLPYQVFDPVVFTRRERVIIKEGARIDSFVKIEGGEGVFIGRYVHIASFAHIGIGGGMVTIGDFAAVASGGKIISGSNQIDALSMSACAPKDIQRVERKMTVLGPYAVVLTNAVVAPGVILGEGAVLAAGGVAMRDIPQWEIWGGVPAKFLKKREIR